MAVLAKGATAEVVQRVAQVDNAPQHELSSHVAGDTEGVVMADKFDIQRALEWAPNRHDSSHVICDKIKVTAFVGNQAVKFDLKAGAEIVHTADGFFATIDCLDGAIDIACKDRNYHLAATSKDSMGFSFPAPYTIRALADSRVLVLVRPWLKRYRTIAEIEAAEDRADIRQARRVLATSKPEERKTLEELKRAVGR